MIQCSKCPATVAPAAINQEGRIVLPDDWGWGRSYATSLGRYVSIALCPIHRESGGVVVPMFSLSRWGFIA